MPSRYPDHEALARVYQGKSSEWLREQLASGALTWQASSAAVEELERRGEALPQSFPRKATGDVPGSDDGGDCPESALEDDARRSRSPRPWWSWMVVVALAFVLIVSQGTHAHGDENQGFLWGVIALQTVVLSLVIAELISALGAKSVAGVIGRIVVIALLGLLLFGLWVLSGLARYGWGG